MFTTFTITKRGIRSLDLPAQDFTYRLATESEIAALQQEPGSPHVMFACTACGKTHWTAKNIALGNHGGYTGARNIFYGGDDAECTCDPSNLKCIVGA